MKKQMKIMIAYDGSSSADAAIDDLIVAGLPLEAEALIVTVSNVLETAIPEQSDFNALKKLVTRTLFVKTVASVEKETQRIWTEAKDLASGCRRRVQSYFPDWQVCEQTALGDPAKELLAIAENWKPDLIVVGSHGRTALGRFFLGSVSAKLSSEAKCSVRVGRRSIEESCNPLPRILIGVDNSKEAERAIRAVANRSWAAETEVRLVSVDDGVSPNRVSAVLPYAARMFEWAQEKLNAAGLQVSIEIKKGSPKSVLLEEARKWHADSIFVAADWMNEFDTKLSELADALVKTASCSVEIVR